jgi:hypothetical protein
LLIDAYYRWKRVLLKNITHILNIIYSQICTRWFFNEIECLFDSWCDRYLIYNNKKNNFFLKLNHLNTHKLYIWIIYQIDFLIRCQMSYLISHMLLPWTSKIFLYRIKKNNYFFKITIFLKIENILGKICQW